MGIVSEPRSGVTPPIPPAGPDAFRMTGKTVFLSGAAGHLGRPMAWAFARAGARVILNGRTPATLEALAEQLRQEGHEVAIAAFDVADARATHTYFSNLARLDVLVNNAISGLAKSSVDGDDDLQFLAMLQSGLVAAHRNIVSAAPALKAAAEHTGDASVINVTSIFAHVSPDFRVYGSSGFGAPPQYAATKGGLLQLTRYMAVKLGAHRVRVNSLSPGVFPWDRIAAEAPAFVSAASQRTPLGRVGQANEIAGPALFLGSPASSYMTGADILVDGGWTAW